MRCKFNQDWFSNPTDYEGKIAPIWTRQQKSAYLTEYLNNYWTDLHQRFSIGRHVYADYKTDISFAVVQGT